MKRKLESLLNSKKLYVFLSFLILAVSYFNMHIKNISEYNLDDKVFTGKLTKIKIDEEKIVFTIKNKETLNCNYYPKNTDDIKYYRNIYELGSEIAITGTLKEPLNNTVPNNFNYKKYLYNHDTYYTCTAENINILKDNTNILYKLKNLVTSRIMSFETSDYMLTLIMGDKSLLDENTFDKYRKNGVTHLFAISGMHIGLFSAVILKILSKFKLKDSIKYTSCIIILWIYAFLTGFPSSVLRACVFFTLLNSFKLAKINLSKLKILFLTGFILILPNSKIIFDIGFLYSFTTSFGLMYTSTFLNKHPTIGTSFIATMYSIPITIQNFYKINLLSCFFNLLFVPLVSLVVYPLCLLTFLFRPIEPLSKMTIFFLEALNNFLAQFDFLYIVIPKLPWILIIIYFIILLIRFDKKPIYTTFILLVLILSSKIIPYLNNYYLLGFIDVNQGDSILLISPHAKEVILIDTGGKENFNDRSKNYHVVDSTITYLNSLGLNKVDFLILTHGDTDHMGDAMHLIETIKVKSVMINRGETNKKEQDLLSSGVFVSKKYNGKINMTFLNDKNWKDENSNSIVTLLNLFGEKVLLMGDASKEVEKYIQEKNDLKNIDIIKLGHHGSKTSSDKTFLSEINPTTAIIMSGRNNRYSHPHKETLNTLNELNIDYLNTQDSGSIIYKITKQRVTLMTTPP